MYTRCFIIKLFIYIRERILIRLLNTREIREETLCVCVSKWPFVFRARLSHSPIADIIMRIRPRRPCVYIKTSTGAKCPREPLMSVLYIYILDCNYGQSKEIDSHRIVYIGIRGYNRDRYYTSALFIKLVFRKPMGTCSSDELVFALSYRPLYRFCV